MGLVQVSLFRDLRALRVSNLNDWAWRDGCWFHHEGTKGEVRARRLGAFVV
jgi:hypothetical protein